MAYEQKDGSGALFKNDKKGNDKRPDYRGDITIGGVKYELAAWLKDGRNGKFMSLNAKPKGERNESAQRNERPAEKQPDFDDDIPF